MISSKILYKLYSIKNLRLRRFLRSNICRIEGGEFYSMTLRKIFEEYHKVDVGLYTHGGCFVPFQVDKHTRIGRYCSIAKTARVMNRNHPLEFKSMHAMFFNPVFNLTDKDVVFHNPLEIGNDVWIGHNSLIMPNVSKISDGAVVAAGAVVNKDVPPYGVVVGNPGRVVRYRFSEDVINDLLESKWWEKSIEELTPDVKEFQQPYKQLVSDENGSENKNAGQGDM